MKLTAISTTGTKNTISASDVLFGGPVKEQLLGQALRVYISNGHQGTSRVKTRAEVNRTKKKWFKQKGTGNARHAARSAPIFVGGGVAHGPKGVRAGNLSLSQKQKQEALKSALSLQSSHIIVSEGLEKLTGKTAATSKTLKKIVADPGLVLMVISKWNADVEQGIRNIPFVKITTAEHVTVVDVCSADTILFSPEAIDALASRLNSTTKKSTKSVAAPKADVKIADAAPKKATAPKALAKSTAKKASKTSTTKKTIKK